jgi:hypothetical protein
MDGLVKQAGLLRGGLEGGKEGLRIIMASVRLAGSYRPGSSKREKATGDLDVNLARDRRDMRVHHSCSPHRSRNSYRTLIWLRMRDPIRRDPARTAIRRII